MIAKVLAVVVGAFLAAALTYLALPATMYVETALNYVAVACLGGAILGPLVLRYVRRSR